MVASERPAPRHVPRTHRPPFPGPRGARGGTYRGAYRGRTGGVQGVGDVEGAVPPRNLPSDPRPPSCRSRHPIGIRRPPVFRGFTQSHAEREGDRRGGHLPEDGGFPSRRSFGGSARPGRRRHRRREEEPKRERARTLPPALPNGRRGGGGGRSVGWLGFRKEGKRFVADFPRPTGGRGGSLRGSSRPGPPARSPERREGGVA